MRVYQLARRLAARHEVTLLSYTGDDGDDVAGLRRELTVEAVRRSAPSRTSKRVAQLRSLVSAQPFASRAVWSDDLQRAVADLCSREAFDVIQLESSLLCSLALPGGTPTVLDEHNIEYEVFERMQDGESSVLRRGFNRVERRRTRAFEQRWWGKVDACVLTSEREEEIVRAVAPATRTAVVPNGVDLDYFCPTDVDPEPQSVVFNGLLRYRPNLDAAYFLVEEIWPLVLERAPGAKLTIVGRGDPLDLKRLERNAVAVAGEVPDIRPFLRRAAVVAVPVRMGGGTRLKVVEGLALGKALVSTTLGCEGVNVIDGEHLVVADSAEAFAAAVVDLFNSPERARRLGSAGRVLMKRDYSWDAAADTLDSLYAELVSSEHQGQVRAPARVASGRT